MHLILLDPVQLVFYELKLEAKIKLFCRVFTIDGCAALQGRCSELQTHRDQTVRQSDSQTNKQYSGQDRSQLRPEGWTEVYKGGIFAQAVEYSLSEQLVEKF